MFRTVSNLLCVSVPLVYPLIWFLFKEGPDAQLWRMCSDSSSQPSHFGVRFHVRSQGHGGSLLQMIEREANKGLALSAHWGQSAGQYSLQTSLWGCPQFVRLASLFHIPLCPILPPTLPFHRYWSLNILLSQFYFSICFWKTQAVTPHFLPSQQLH